MRDPPDYGRRVIDAFRNGKLTAIRTTEFLWGTASEEELPPQREILLNGLLREFDPLVPAKR